MESATARARGGPLDVGDDCGNVLGDEGELLLELVRLEKEFCFKKVRGKRKERGELR